ncbi:MAG: class I SAM-dependent methyltransferase [Ignavibacteria bacterium]
MNSILEEIITTGNTRTVEGDLKKVVGQISEEEGKLIQDSINEINAEVSVEVGLAFGTSALYICEALKKTEKTKHYIIDPYQMYDESYGGIGVNNLKKAGYQNIFEFIEKPSHSALALLEMQNVKVDFAFIDGWHTFDHVLTDFFLVDKILRVGGIVILDDTDWPAITKVASFISINRSYKFLGGSSQRSYIKKNHSNSGNSIKKFKDFLNNKKPDNKNVFGAMAFKKTADDIRSWDHYINF